MEEIWKPVVGYEGLYEVSNLGNVRSIDRIKHVVQPHREYDVLIKGKLIVPQPRQHGYLAVWLYGHGGNAKKNGKQLSVHRIVAEAFIPNPVGYTEVNHIDECKTNNRVDNLEWCTHKQNSVHGTRGKRISNSNKNNPKRCKPIAQYTRDGELVRIFPSLIEASRNGYDSSNICNCAKGHPSYSHAYGYIWRYLTD